MSFIYDKEIRKFCEWEKNIDNTFVPKPQISYNIEVEIENRLFIYVTRSLSILIK